MELARQLLVLDPGRPLDVRGPRGETRLELAAPDHPERDLRCEARRLQHRVEAVKGDQLADEQGGERLPPLPAGLEDPLLRADEADRHLPVREPGPPGEVVGVRLGVGDDEIGRAQRVAVHRRQRASGQRAGAEAAPVVHERVLQ